MQFTTALLAASTAALTSALPAPAPIPGAPVRFGVIAIRSGSPIQNLALQAKSSQILIGSPDQGASCDGTHPNSATFYITSEGEMFLNRRSATPQKLFVDRSGMGQGVIGYVTGAQPVGRNSETVGWSIEGGQLKFDGTGLQACPGTDGWSVWLQGLDKPGFIDGCLTFDNMVVETENPDSCYYSEYQPAQPSNGTAA